METSHGTMHGSTLSFLNVHILYDYVTLFVLFLQKGMCIFFPTMDHKNNLLGPDHY